MGTSVYEEGVAALGDDLPARRQVVENWLGAYTEATGADTTDLAEAVAVELCPGLARYECAARLTERVEGLLGSHPHVERRSMTARIDELLPRARHFREEVAPGFRAYQPRTTALAATERDMLRLDEHRPRLMPAGQGGGAP